MKKAIKSFIVLVAIATNTHNSIAQTPYDDFAPSNKKKEMLKLPEVKYKISNSDSTNSYNYLLFDKENQTLTYYSRNDSIINIFTIPPNDFKWLSVDPLASKYPYVSPYNFVLNNPMNAIDPDGRDVIFLIDKEGAGGKGHMGMLFQDKNGAWNYFTQGAAENGSTSGFISGNNYTGGVGIMPMQTVTKTGEIFNMTKEQAIAFVQSGGADGTEYDNTLTLKTTKDQDVTITSNAYSLQNDFQTKKEKYNVYTNNCTDAVQDVIEGSKGIKTGITLPNDTDPRPNEYFKQLQSTVPWLNGDLKLVTIPSTMDNILDKKIVVPNLQSTP